MDSIDYLEKIAQQQQMKIRKLADSRGFCLTDEDLLQPNDYPALESDAEFRYEEGVREGIWTCIAALRALKPVSFSKSGENF